METSPDSPDTSEQSPKQSSLVVVGASAGGVEALSTLVATLPVGFPAPIVLAQHLDPHHPSHLAEILARYSRLPVQTATDQAPLEPGTIYVIPADRNVEVTDHALRLRTDVAEKRPKPSINLLFSSAAQAFGEHLIAVILTGTGSDGASGAYQVKSAGGLVIIENPKTAAYPALPASLAPTTVDFVADLERIGPLLHEILTESGLPKRLISLSDESAAMDAYMQHEADENEQALHKLLNQVREHSSIDFSQYKAPTILRRLHRRMFATDTTDLSAYMHYLESHPEEYQLLVGSFLIKVTEFFRDRELFAALRERVLPELIEEARKRGNVLRIWSAGCATGEEAYSLAILLSEVLGEELDQFSVQIFATDVDEVAIEFARHGIYPAAALAGVSQRRLARYFQKLDGTYQIAKSLRAIVIFGLHDLGLRAPFPHIDLVLCRNVLMYFTKDLQARALQLFAFSLRDGGYLALGSAETANPVAAYFNQVSPSLRLYRRHGERVLGPIPTVESLQGLVIGLRHPHPRPPLYSNARTRATLKPSLQQEVLLGGARNSNERLGLLVLGLPVGVVVVDRHYDIQIINSQAMRLLGIFTTAIGEDLIHLAQTIPSNALRTVIDAAFRDGSGAAYRAEPLQQPTTPAEPTDILEGVVTIETMLGERRSLQFTCYPYVQPTLEEIAAEDEVEQTGVEAEKPGWATGEADNTAARQALDVSLVLILVRDVTDMVRAREELSHATAELEAEHLASQARMQSELETTAQRLQSENARLKAEIERQSEIYRSLLEGNQKLAAANLALRATNEDLQVSEEEAEASTEEVKTLNEELQATNEELVTVNEELEATVEELHAANDELEARTRELQEMAAALEEQRRSTPK